jgi:uncharacterized damage-inducible protein DinB
MRSSEVLVDGYDRVRGVVHRVIGGLDTDQLTARLEGRANPIGWLVWHLTRVQDDHLAEVTGAEQVWTAQGWAGRFGLPYPVGATGYGHGPEEVAAFAVSSGELLTGYYDTVHAQTVDYVSGLTDTDLDRVVDPSWDPPVTLGVRLVSVLADDLQHAGQAAYARGLLDARHTRDA